EFDYNSSDFALSDFVKLRTLTGRPVYLDISISILANPNEMNVENARRQMLGQQVRAWEVFDERVLEAMRETPRELFVPEAYRDLAFVDSEIPLGGGQYMMAPKVEGRLLQALQLEPNDRVLEVGTGSGYLTACLARLAGRVLSVD